MYTLADPGGTARFFHFDIQIFRNVATLGVGARPYEVGAPLREILDPPLVSIFQWEQPTPKGQGD